jgi:hypothetical protein
VNFVRLDLRLRDVDALADDVAREVEARGAEFEAAHGAAREVAHDGQHPHSPRAEGRRADLRVLVGLELDHQLVRAGELRRTGPDGILQILLARLR